MFFVLFLILVSLTINLKKKYTRPSKFYSAVFNAGYHFLCRCAGARVTVTGLEKIPLDKKFLLICNHRSKFDNMIASYILKKWPIAYVSKPENFSIPMGRRYMHRSCYIPLNRNSPKDALAVIDEAVRLIRNDLSCIGIFPEGTRSDSSSLLPFKAGCLRIAKNAHCPIVVITVDGTEKIHKNFPWHKTQIKLDVLEVISEQEVDSSKTVELADKAYKLMNENLYKTRRQN
jgi:1-acyl-sn-glycerol-3-phosphate acyltransferase